MEPIEQSETIEIDAQRFITLEFSRQWPKYVVSWWVRQRVGESDFPVAEGAVDRLPSHPSTDREEVWAELRQTALDQAMQAATSAGAGSEQSKGRSFLDRLLRRG